MICFETFDLKQSLVQEKQCQDMTGNFACGKNRSRAANDDYRQLWDKIDHKLCKIPVEPGTRKKDKKFILSCLSFLNIWAHHF